MRAWGAHFDTRAGMYGNGEDMAREGIRRICYGNYQHTGTGITIERNRDAATGNMVEITYEVPEEDALGTQPEMGTRTDLLGGGTEAPR